MAVDLYPVRARTPDDLEAFGGRDVKLVTSGTDAWICLSDPHPQVVEQLSNVWASRVHGRWVLADVATSQVLFVFEEGQGCGCGDPMKRWDPRPAPVRE